MRSLAEIRARTPKSEIFRRQLLHVLLATLLTYGTLSLYRQSSSQDFNLGPYVFFLAAIAFTLLHQILVAIVFRLQLHLNLMVRMFGKYALIIWGIIFLPLLVLRPTLVLMAGLADTSELLPIAPMYHLPVGAILLIPAIWGMHSVIKYFTIPRALGGDHFYDRYANMPMVREGIFKYSSNAMYTFVFIGFWAIAILTNSWNALVLAAFNHAYIWVHMYCTEGPDMRVIYGDD